MSFILLILGFIFLIKGANYFVEGSSSIARKLHIPSMVIGLTIVAMGTSAPELSVSVTSALVGQNDLSVANVVGSNIFNLLMVLGVSSLIAKLPIEKGSIKFDTPFLIGISLLLLIMLFDLNIGRFEGLVLMFTFVLFLLKTIKSVLKNKSVDEEVKEEKPLLKMIFISLVGIVGIIFGGDLVVDSASEIAEMFGMSQNLIGLTVVAVGTSLPEFVTSVIATKKGETEIAIGNVIGSNIFNILLILGVSATISPMIVSMVTIVDVLFMIATTILFLLFVSKNKVLCKYQGIIFILLYIGYISYTIIR